jgi:hypothetical protein
VLFSISIDMASPYRRFSLPVTQQEGGQPFQDR